MVAGCGALHSPFSSLSAAIVPVFYGLVVKCAQQTECKTPQMPVNRKPSAFPLFLNIL